MSSIDEIKQARLKKLELLKQAGVNPFPSKVARDIDLLQFKQDFDTLEN